MELTLKDRLVLANQYRILAALYPGEAAHFEKCREAVENGYALDYGELTPEFK
jgi:uncharacterized protein YfbU (UPF0304 family)